MSKAAKLRAKEERLKKKRAHKASMTATWETYAKTGQNVKSKRNRNKVKNSSHMRPRTHPHGNCHNHGCKKCYPKLNAKPEWNTNQYDLLHAFYPEQFPL